MDGEQFFSIPCISLNFIMSNAPSQRKEDEESRPGATSDPVSEQDSEKTDDDDPRDIEPIKNGYREIAHLMAYKNSPFAIFRRFGQLNMLNLLCLQAELMELQSEFRDVCEEDDKQKVDTDAHKFAYSFVRMREQYQEEQKQAGSRERSRLKQEQINIVTALRDPDSDAGRDAYARLLSELVPRAPDQEQEGSIAHEVDEEPVSQYRLILKIRKKLKEYSKS